MDDGNKDDYDDANGNSIAFNWDVGDLPIPQPTSSPFAQVQPIFKEFIQALESSSPNTGLAGAGMLKNTLSEFNSLHVLASGKGPPKGGIVSGKIESKNSKLEPQEAGVWT